MAVALLAVGVPSPAHAQALATQYTAPAGWARVEKEGTVFLMPGGEPPGTVVVTILPLTPRWPDLDAQVTSLRTSFEASLGLREMRQASYRRAAGSGFETRSHVAVYTGAGGERRFALMARAEGGMVGTVIFFGTSREAYDRQRGVATDLFNGMRLIPYPAPSASPDPSSAQAGAPPPRAAAATAPTAAGAGARPASYRGAGIVGVWTGWRTVRTFGGGFHSESAYQAWFVFFDDGRLLQTFPDAGLAALDQEAHRARFPAEWLTWTFDGTAGMIQRLEGAAPWKLKLLGPDLLEINESAYRRCPDVDGLKLQGSWYQLSGDDAGDPDFTRRPRGRRPLIHFTREGRFDDEGLFAVAMPSKTGGDDRAGAGTYEVKDFSITLRYDDGRVRQEAFPGRGPALLLGGGKDDRIFFRDVGLQKR
jgi:hypothetical protein